MHDVIGSLLPFALIIAFGPVPIITIAIMFQTASPKRTSAGFAVGWLLGIAAMTAVSTLLSSQIPEGDPENPLKWVGLVQMLLGAGLIAFALKKIFSRMGASDEAVVPGFLASLTETTPRRGVLVGVIASVAFPKHAILIIPVGTLIAKHGLAIGELVFVMGMFVLLSSLTVVGPAFAYVISPDKVGAVADAAYRWMVRNMAIVSAAVLILIGWGLLGKGITNFW